MIGDSNGTKSVLPVWFIETKRFTSGWRTLQLGAADLLNLQDIIKVDPTSHPVVPGTGGLRKMRFAPTSFGKGKRGSLRVCYAYLPRFSVIVLVLVYPKSKIDNLSPAEKKTVKKLLKEIEKEFEQRFQR